MRDCLCCNRVEDALGEKNPYVVGWLKRGLLVVSDTFAEDTKFIYILNQHTYHMSDLTVIHAHEMVEDLSTIDEFLRREFAPTSIHYQLLGDFVPHLHWHITPQFPKTNTEEWAKKYKGWWERYEIIKGIR